MWLSGTLSVEHNREHCFLWLQDFGDFWNLFYSDSYSFTFPLIRALWLCSYDFSSLGERHRKNVFSILLGLCGGTNELPGNNSDSPAALIETPWKASDCGVERWKFVLFHFGKIEVYKKGPVCRYFLLHPSSCDWRRWLLKNRLNEALLVEPNIRLLYWCVYLCPSTNCWAYRKNFHTWNFAHWCYDLKIRPSWLYTKNFPHWSIFSVLQHENIGGIKFIL